jgi:hypothetical protein
MICKHLELEGKAQVDSGGKFLSAPEGFHTLSVSGI